ncbi:hypothetical protein ADK70_12505 [Streptomyces rimosus subsp. pseudoverticillatus]|uniref:hypothetical protein n=1 Tax=Streptomyces rimosus TaxID=1927 RepID=UPI0006B27E32|nr:hypothetical protein [Streptomyces rimosus]KOT94494.1 hypothetical protein ADK70_12505 [Streptomyces rimosus subsp. pseudoverticillatus]
MNFSQSTTGERRTAGIPIPPGWHMRSHNPDTDVAVDVAVQAVARCHACGTVVPFGIGEVRGDARAYVDGPYRDGLRAAWEWTDEHLTACPKTRTANDTNRP